MILLFLNRQPVHISIKGMDKGKTITIARQLQVLCYSLNFQKKYSFLEIIEEKWMCNHFPCIGARGSLPKASNVLGPALHTHKCFQLFWLITALLKSGAILSIM